MRAIPFVFAAAAIGIAAATAPRPPVRRAPDPGTPAPELVNNSWFNTDQALHLVDLKGRVVLLNFWVFTCGNCTRTVPALVELDRRYRDQGLTIIGIHTPEFPPYAGEHSRGNVARALARLGIVYPNAQDNDRTTWDAYGIRYWPSFVLIDKRGRIRDTGFGEFHRGDTEAAAWARRIERLLAEPDPAPVTLRRSDDRLVLLPARGVRINARLKPALELPGGSVLRFDSRRLTPDSDYFAEPPNALLPPGTAAVTGTLRVSICRTGESICRSFTELVTL